MIPVHIQQFPVKLSGGHKFCPVQEKMGNPEKVGTIDKSNRPKKLNNRRKRQGKHLCSAHSEVRAEGNF